GHLFGEALQRRDSGVPVDTAIGDGLAIDQFLAGDEVLAAGDEVGFHHDADDAAVAGGELGADIGKDQRLVFRLLGRVGVAGVDHDRRRDASLFGGGSGGIDTGGIMVGGFAAAQDDVAIRVAGGGGNT